MNILRHVCNTPKDIYPTQSLCGRTFKRPRRFKRLSLPLACSDCLDRLIALANERR